MRGFAPPLDYAPDGATLDTNGGDLIIRKQSRPLENALLFSLGIHAVAMLSMVALLLPGLPGGGVEALPARAAHVASSPLGWRLGWLPWQLTALSDLLISAALLDARWVPRRASITALLLTVIAVAFDQLGQILWITEGVRLAEAAVATGHFSEYAAFEARAFTLTGFYGTVFYTLGALAWTYCFTAAGVWSRPLTVLSAVTWPLFAYLGAGPILPDALRASPQLVAGGNAVAFVLLEVWLALVLEQLLRASRPTTRWGRDAPWIHPRGGVLGAALELAANSRLLRRMAGLLPSVAFVSDMTDILYVNYLLPAKQLAQRVPEGLELQRLGPGGEYALLTFLSYRHGHLGPAALGPLRRLLPSPVQSNWRIHVKDPRTGQLGIYFFSNAIDSALHALAARLLSEGMPMHLLHRASVSSTEPGAWSLLLDPGRGSAPDARATLRAGPVPVLTGAWANCFVRYRDFLAYCVPQDRALSSQPWAGSITRQEIVLGIPLDACEPLEGEVSSRAAEQLTHGAQPLCFRVAKVTFRFDREERDAYEPQSV